MASDDGEELALVAKEVSEALLATDPDLLGAVKALTPLWAQELDAAREDARQQQAAILARRVDLRDAFVHGAKLTEILGPSRSSRDPSQRPSSPISALAASEPAAAAIALKNMSHTLHLLRFLEAAPDLIKAATEMLDRVAELSPESSDLFQSHQNICACVRIRDYALLDALPNLDYAGMLANIFAGLEQACEQLEHYLMANIFSAVPLYAQTDPRVLVAAVRIVQLDREEDDWWQDFLETGALTSAGSLVRPDGRRDYEKRMYDAIVKSIEHEFSKRPSAARLSVDNTLKWLKKLLNEEQESRRFVVPCFPAAYEVGDLYTTEYHRSIMAVITELFRATGDRSAAEYVDDDDADVVKIVEWYREYRWGPSGATLAASSLELPRGQRDRLVAAVARHGKAKLLAKVNQVVQMDASSVIWHKNDVETEVAGDLSSDDAPLALSGQKDDGTGICTTAGPERIFGAIGQQVKDARVLGVPAVNTALAKVVKVVLTTFQDAIRQMFKDRPPSTVEEEDYVCATANNMARCLEYAEELREAMSPFVVEESRTSMEQEFEEVIDDFRDIAGIAVSKLADSVSADAMPPKGFFAPRTGTEVMLDVIGILGGYFSRYEMALMPFHYEVFAGCCLKHVVSQYLKPLASLGQISSSDSLLGRSSSDTKLSLDATSAGLTKMGAHAIVAQMDKDGSNLFAFFKENVKVLDKKHLDIPSAAIGSVRALMTCRPTTQFLAAAHANAVEAVSRLTGASPNSGLQFTVEASGVLWNARPDIKTTTRLEAESRARRESNEDHLDSADGFDKSEASGVSLMWKPRRAVV